ncbi:MAG: C cytochrome precursor [Verrucomicrobia bacterium]|nr:C cytochrome precursor [Verrucomicrobiota bacterium]
MNLEWLLFLLLVPFVLLPLFTRTRRSNAWRWGAGLSVVALTVLGAGFWERKQFLRASTREAFLKTVPRQGRPDGYLSSDQCASCHPDQYASWHGTFHRTMTQYASLSAVVGRFDVTPLELNGETYRLEKRGEEFWVEMPDPDWKSDPVNAQRAKLGTLAPAPRVWKRVGLLTGSHHMQIYWVSSRVGNLQRLFPFAWLIADQRWVPVHDTFLRDPTFPPFDHIWNVNCIKCHSTGGQPQVDARTGTVDTRAGELGIACEACHGPAEEHVRVNHDLRRRYLAHRENKGDVTVFNPKRSNKQVSSQACGQCHGIKWIPAAENFNAHGFRFRPGQDLNETTPVVRPALASQKVWLSERLKQSPKFVEEHYWSDGMVRVSGREYNGLVDSACHERGELSCVSCHSAHASKPDDQLAAKMETSEACLQCHDSFRKKIREHTHHAPGSSGSECYNCHMPYTTYGLLKAIRSHKIDSPSVSSSVQTGRPNACNLCHLDQSLGWTAQHLKEWYNLAPVELTTEQKEISAAVLWLLKGDAGQRALIAYSMGWDVAKMVSGQDWLAPYLAQLLVDPYSAVRYIAGRSLQRLQGYEKLNYDFVASPNERAKAQTSALGIWRQASASRLDRSGARILIESGTGLQQERFDRILKQRDDHSMDLQE